MELNIATGLTHTSTCEVGHANSARTLGSGTLDVFATPAMIALMENAALNAVTQSLPEGCDTVGTEMNTTHVKASPFGEQITAVAKLVAVEGRKLTFDVVASDSQGEIGRGVHTRFVIDVEKFMGKLQK